MVKEHGGIDRLVLEELDIPTPLADGVVIQIKAAALNHIDIWVRRGIPGMDFHLPHPLGSDGSGVVIQVGKDVKSIQVGESVVIFPGVSCGSCEYCRTGEESMCTSFSVIGEQHPGTFAEYVSLPEKCVYPKPGELSFDEAAAFPLVFLTAWRMLITKARLKPGDTVLILGIGGGVSGAALQIAKLVGCRVFVTSRDDEKLNKAKALGADGLINSVKTDFAREVRMLTGKRGVDVVVDSVGGDSFQKSVLCLAKGGKVATCGATTGAGPPLDIPRIFWNHLSILGSTLGNHKEFLEVLRAIRQNSLHPIIDSVYPLEEARAAQSRMESGAQFGKIILNP